MEAFQSALRRIPEEASRELTGEGRKVCVCVDGKARQDLNSESQDFGTSVRLVRSSAVSLSQVIFGLS